MTGSRAVFRRGPGMACVSQFGKHTLQLLMCWLPSCVTRLVEEERDQDARTGDCSEGNDGHMLALCPLIQSDENVT